MGRVKGAISVVRERFRTCGVFSPPVVLLKSEPLPIAVLLLAVVLLKRAWRPAAVLPPPVVLLNSA
jgi:hypothetical protein